MSIITCRPRVLSPDRIAEARRRAMELNPANALERRVVERTPAGRPGGRKRLAIVIGRRWPTTGVRLTVSFMDAPERALRKRIIQHMNAWSETANVRFAETNGTGQVRIARLDTAPDDGYWSYIGTEILGIPDDEPTLNLQEFTMDTPEKEFHRVVRHEAGHTLGFEHEHMRAALVKKIDRRKAYRFFDIDQGWSKEEVDDQVLTPLAARSIMGTRESDPHSIMCYQIPGSITKTGRPIPGGNDINARDKAFAAAMYPKKVHRVTARGTR